MALQEFIKDGYFFTILDYGWPWFTVSYGWSFLIDHGWSFSIDHGWLWLAMVEDGRPWLTLVDS